jgi:hypothetical protein
VLVGLGAGAGPVHVRVQWPDGSAGEWPRVEANRWTVLRRGESK